MFVNSYRKVISETKQQQQRKNEIMLSKYEMKTKRRKSHLLLMCLMDINSVKSTVYWVFVCVFSTSISVFFFLFNPPMWYIFSLSLLYLFLLIQYLPWAFKYINLSRLLLSATTTTTMLLLIMVKIEIDDYCTRFYRWTSYLMMMMMIFEW